jgi:hypothetical protein
MFNDVEEKYMCCIFIYGLFNDSVSNADNIALNGRMIRE